jgi:nicotinamidase-related amidase
VISTAAGSGSCLREPVASRGGTAGAAREPTGLEAGFTSSHQGGTTMTDATHYRRLECDDAAVLLVDHQSGLLSLVRDFEPDTFRNNVLALADLAHYFELPTVLTTSFEDGPNGPLVPELKAKVFAGALYRAAGSDQRLGQRRLRGRRTQDRPATAHHRRRRDRGLRCLSGAVGTSGRLRGVRRDRRLRHLQRGDTAFGVEPHDFAGAQLMSWFGVACELHRDWRRDVEGLGALFANHIPDYRNLITSHSAFTGTRG